ncbi:MAG: Hsp20/alpha crystallin family protein [Beijerinckiaceae bacterium]
MSFRSFLPSLWASNTNGTTDPINNLRQEIDRAFESFGKSLPSLTLPSVTWQQEAIAPKINIVQKDKTLEITAELPGVELQDVELLVEDDMLTIKGNKKVEKEDKTAERHVFECAYGSFSRSVQLPFEVEPEVVKADFKNGVLTISIPVPAIAEAKAQKVEIKAAA